MLSNLIPFFLFQLIAEIKKVFASATVTGEEFPRLMAILNMTYLPKSTAGQVGAQKPFPSDDDKGSIHEKKAEFYEKVS